MSPHYGTFCIDLHMGIINIFYTYQMILMALTMVMVGKQKPQTFDHGQGRETKT
jgi:hypothetical protein